VFGRKRLTERTTVTYLGVNNEDRAVFLRYSVDIESDATAMNSSPVPVGDSYNHSGTVNGKSYSGTTTRTTYVTPEVPRVRLSGERRIELTVSLRDSPYDLIVDGYRIVVHSANPTRVVCSIEEPDQQAAQ
jgi:hypothetical protein